jgi:hypothetical protein
VSTGIIKGMASLYIRTALRAFDFDIAISDTLDATYVLDKGLRRLRRERNDSCDAHPILRTEISEIA